MHSFCSFRAEKRDSSKLLATLWGNLNLRKVHLSQRSCSAETLTSLSLLLPLQRAVPAESVCEVWLTCSDQKTPAARLVRRLRKA